MPKIMEAIQPTDIDISNHLFDTFGSCEKEIVARNIIFIARKKGAWVPISWEEYKKECTHHVTESERFQLNALVRDKVLSLEEGKYSITPTFISKIAAYITD